MERFVPKRAFFEPEALAYPIGQEIHKRLVQLGVDIHTTGSHNRVTGIPGKTAGEAYREAKQTLVVGVRKSSEYATCKPSAHFQLPLNTSCPSMCEYCYLATTLGKKPYLRVYVNMEDIFARAERYMEERKPEITVFEGAATSDPIPTEYLTGTLKRTIEFFGRQEYGRFRFVTKHDQVDTLLDARHEGHTRFRFSLNAAAIITKYEHLTPGLAERVTAAAKVARAGYPLGFIIAPIIHYPGWREGYQELFAALDAQLPSGARDDLTFELITHRFTKRAKTNILGVFPQTGLPMEESERQFKYGQFGYGKYIYTKATREEIKDFMTQQIGRYFPQARTDYFV